MGKCWKCGKEVTLKEEETRCDDCGEILRYWCHNCTEPFDIEDENSKEKIVECKVCGFFICPNCGVCGDNCQKKEWFKNIKEIMESNFEFNIKLNKICDLIEQIKIGKERRLCDNNVSISYAKNRIKSCICRTQGYRVKNIADKEKFSERLQKVLEIPIEKEMTVEEFRESGSYGQEWRDILNTSVCYGWIEVIYKKNKQGDEYALYKRIDKNPCKFLDEKNLFTKFCNKCKKSFDISEEYCDKCVYVKNTNKHIEGEKYGLKLKISNKDICQLPRSEFKIK